MRKIKFAAILILVALVFWYWKANTERASFSKKIDDLQLFVEELYQKDILDGEILVAQGKNILFHRKSKYLENLHYQPQFLIASISKHFTSAALLKALYESCPSLDESEKYNYVLNQLQKPIITFLPPEKFLWGSTVPVWANTITLHHLLTHTSGLVQHVRLMFERKGYEFVDSFFRIPHSAAEIIQSFGHEPLEFDPGSKYSYSNLGYELLAEVVTSITNMPYCQYLEKQIFEPNNMALTCNPICGSSYNLKQLPTCTQLVPEMLYDSTMKNPSTFIAQSNILSDIGSAQGSGGIVSTAQDLWQWNRSLHELKTVLPQTLYNLYIQPKYAFNQHAYGLWNRNGIIHCTGKYGSYISQLVYISQHNISIIMLSHIDRDGLATYKKVKELESKLSIKIKDKDELQKVINETMQKDYSHDRGSMLLFKYLHNLVDTLEVK